MHSSDFPIIFDTLKAILRPYEESPAVERDQPGDYSLNTHFIGPNKKPLFFGAVTIRKNYVSFHLMPVYVFPVLLEGVSPELKKRMQGKSCFNFRKLDEDILTELAQLTQKGYERFRSKEIIEKFLSI